MTTRRELENLEATQATADRHGVDLYAADLRVEYDTLTPAGWCPMPAKRIRTVAALQRWENRNPVRVRRVTVGG